MNELIENHLRPNIPHKKRHEQNKPENIIFTDKELFKQKLSNFVDSYYKNKRSVAIVTDFDYTLTSRIDYKTGKLYSSSYYCTKRHQNYTIGASLQSLCREDFQFRTNAFY